MYRATAIVATFFLAGWIADRAPAEPVTPCQLLSAERPIGAHTLRGQLLRTSFGDFIRDDSCLEREKKFVAVRTLLSPSQSQRLAAADQKRVVLSGRFVNEGSDAPVNDAGWVKTLPDPFQVDRIESVSNASPSVPPGPLSVCEAIANPSDILGKRIVIRGRLESRRFSTLSVRVLVGDCSCRTELGDRARLVPNIAVSGTSFFQGCVRGPHGGWGDYLMIDPETMRAHSEAVRQLAKGSRLPAFEVQVTGYLTSALPDGIVDESDLFPDGSFHQPYLFELFADDIKISPRGPTAPADSTGKTIACPALNFRKPSSRAACDAHDDLAVALENGCAARARKLIAETLLAAPSEPISGLPLLEAAVLSQDADTIDLVLQSPLALGLEDLEFAARLAIRTWNTASLRQLLSTGAIQPSPDLLVEAAKFANLETLEEIAEVVGDVNTPDSRGWTPLHGAIVQAFQFHRPTAYLESIRFLLSKGADPKPIIPGGQPTLVIAAISPDIAEALLAHGADPNQAPSNGVTPLMLAAGSTECRSVELLLNAGAHISARDQEANTALHHAVRGNHIDCIPLLLAAGADLNARNGNGQTPGEIALSLPNAPYLLEALALRY